MLKWNLTKNITSYIFQTSDLSTKKYLWLIRVLNRDALRAGNASFSRNKGFASMSFFNSRSMIPLADFVSPYLDSCSFSLWHHIKLNQNSVILRRTQLNPKYRYQPPSLQNTWNFLELGVAWSPCTIPHWKRQKPSGPSQECQQPFLYLVWHRHT